jgi:predicted  nucleic acid-binding Zn-ribbon protein
VTVDVNNTSETEATEAKPEEQAKPETGTEKPNDIAAMESAVKKANKEAEKLRLKLKEIEDAGKSETDKLRDEADTAKRDAEAARKQVLRLQVGVDKNLPKSLISRLQGDTEEEMAADADVLLDELKPGKPRGDVDAGPRGKDPSESGTDMDSLLRAAARGS